MIQKKMPKTVEKVENVKMTCDECGTSSENTEELKVWFEIRSSVKNGLILLEKNDANKPYESFHVPDKKVVIFCSQDCARKNLNAQIDVFLSQITQ